MDRETLEANQFFLVYHGGGGYSQADVDAMTLPELFARASRLYKQKEREKEAQAEAARKAKQKTRR